MGKGSNTTTTSSATSADPQAAQAYRDLITRAQGVASTPYQAYSGNLTADVNSQQNLGIGGINANANFASPYIQQASGLAGAASAPITGQQIQSYQNPYTQQVVDATTNQLQHDNSQQMAQLQGNQISQGALGGNATGVAKGILAGQQGRTMASTTAGLYDQSYQQAVRTAQQQQQTGLAGANAQANYGISGQAAGLAGAGQQIAAGGLQQQTEQARLNAMYGQYAQAQAYPYQQAQWLAGISTGVGSQLGGTSQGTSTAPAPNPLSQILGLGLAGAGAAGGLGWRPFAASGGAINSFASGGGVAGDGDAEAYNSPYQIRTNGGQHQVINIQTGQVHYTGTASGASNAQATLNSRRYAAGGGVGGVPWEGAQGWIPTMQIHAGQGAPRGSSPGGGQQQPAFDPAKFMSGLGGAGRSLGLGSGTGVADGDWYGPSSVGGAPLSGYENSSPYYGPGFAQGGSVEGSTFDVTDFDERWRGEPRSTAWEHFKGGARDFAGGMRDIVTGVAPPRSPIGTSRTLWDRDRRNGYARGGGATDIMNGDPSWMNPDIGPGYRPSGMPDMMNGDPGWENPDVGPGYAGVVPPLSFADRAAPVTQAAADGTFDPQGANSTDFAGGVGSVPTPRGRPVGAGAPVVAEDDDEAPAPTGVAGRPGGAPMGRQMAFAPEGPGSYGEMPDAIAAPQDGAYGIKGLSRNVPAGLLAAGLGMMASRSPHLGTAVGEGGLAGVGAYGAAENNDRKVAMEAAKLSQEARKQFTADAMGERKQTETERHNKASEKDTAANRAPMGMRFKKNGELEDIPGWVDTLSKAAKARKGPEGEVMDDDTAQFMADRIISGDTKVLTGLGRGAQGAANIMKVQKLVAARAASGEPVSQAAREILNNAAQFEGLKTAERTQAAIMAKLSVYGRTAFNATDLAIELSKAVPRTEFQPVNKILNAARTKTGDPKIVALGQALQTLSNEYARAIGGGHGTVHMQEQAEKRLSEQQTQEQLEAVINVMRREILAEERAMPQARQHIRDIYNPRPGGAQGKSIAGEHGAQPPPGPVGGASGNVAPPAAVEMLKKNPALAPQFDQKYGAGASRQYLGQ